jgi:hypothetical protein
MFEPLVCARCNRRLKKRWYELPSEDGTRVLLGPTCAKKVKAGFLGTTRAAKEANNETSEK